MNRMNVTPSITDNTVAEYRRSNNDDLQAMVRKKLKHEAYKLVEGAFESALTDRAILTQWSKFLLFIQRSMDIIGQCDQPHFFTSMMNFLSVILIFI